MPDEVSERIKELLDKYNSIVNITLKDLAEYYHALQDNDPEKLKIFFEKEQVDYFGRLKEFLFVYEKV